uniref:Uncharacterized protein n=1 Tax=Tetraselmis sp. GSL018 TaxID=582737 RepID=A0A061RK65_9CHLO
MAWFQHRLTSLPSRAVTKYVILAFLEDAAFGFLGIQTNDRLQASIQSHCPFQAPLPNAQLQPQSSDLETLSERGLAVSLKCRFSSRMQCHHIRVLYAILVQYSEKLWTRSCLWHMKAVNKRSQIHLQRQPIRIQISQG